MDNACWFAGPQCYLETVKRYGQVLTEGFDVCLLACPAVKNARSRWFAGREINSAVSAGQKNRWAMSSMSASGRISSTSMPISQPAAKPKTARPPECETLNVASSGSARLGLLFELYAI